MDPKISRRIMTITCMDGSRDDLCGYIGIPGHRESPGCSSFPGPFPSGCLAKEGPNPGYQRLCLYESYTVIRLRAGHAVVVQFGEAIRHSQLLRIVYVTPEIIEEAWRLSKAYADHDFSFTDCTTFSLMERLSIPLLLLLTPTSKNMDAFR